MLINSDSSWKIVVFMICLNDLSTNQSIWPQSQYELRMYNCKICIMQSWLLFVNHSFSLIFKMRVFMKVIIPLRCKEMDVVALCYPIVNFFLVWYHFSFSLRWITFYFIHMMVWEKLSDNYGYNHYSKVSIILAKNVCSWFTSLFE